MRFKNKAMRWFISAFALSYSLIINATEEFVDPAKFAWLAYNSSAAAYMPTQNNSFIQNGLLMKNWSSTKISEPGRCADGFEKDGGLCYPKCADGFYGVGPVCWRPCPEGYHDDGMTCRQDRTHAKDSYGRGVGTLPPCRNGKIYDAGLCYPQCQTGYKGVGPVCWRQCNAPLVDTGAICQDPDVYFYAKESYGRTAGVPLTKHNYEEVYDELACYNPGWTGSSRISSAYQHYTIARNEQEKVTVFSFRGTYDPDDILVFDNAGEPTDYIIDKTVSLYEHYWLRFTSVADQLRAALEATPADHKVILTGHSIGGSVASIAAPHFSQWGRKPDSVILFGAPLTGDNRFKSVYNDLVGCNRTLRIKVSGDLTTDFAEHNDYTHVCDATEVNYNQDTASNLDIFIGYAEAMRVMFDPETTDSRHACAVDSVVLFDEKSQQGDHLIATGNVRNLGDFNDRLSSFAMPKDWTVRFYERPNFGGGFYTRTANLGDATDFDNKIQSLQILKRPNALALFDGIQKGDAVYLTEDMADLGNFKNKMSSFNIPRGWTVRFFEQTNFQGGYYTFDSAGEHSATEFANRIQSVKILSKNSTFVNLYDQTDRVGEPVQLNESTPNLGDFNNKMSSFIIPNNWTVRFFEDVNYQGGFYTYSAGQYNARDFNNKIKSVQILSKN